MRRLRCSGISLVELLISWVIMGLVLASAITLVVACYRHHLDGDTASSLNDRVLTTLVGLQREMKDGSRTSVRVFDTPPGVVFASPRRADSSLEFSDTTLRPKWQKWVCYYIEPADFDFHLIRKEEVFATPADSPPRVPDDKSTAYFQGSVGGGRLVARGVVELQLLPGPPMVIGLTCREVAHRGTSTESEFSHQISTKVTYRN